MSTFLEKTKIDLKDEYVVASQVSWDILFYDDIMNHDGFVISDPATMSLDGKKEKSMFGPNSPLFGTTYGDEQAFMERHRCKCGEFKGLEFLGETCPLCHTKIEARELDIKKTAWIPLDDNVVINPYWYKVFERIIGKNQFNEIVTKVEKVDADGIRHDVPWDPDKPPRTPFPGIGIDGFYDRYDEILEWARSKKAKDKDKNRVYDIARKSKYKAFTHHIPVYSTFLRPSSTTADTYYFNGIDKEINTTVNLSMTLRDCEPIEKPYIQTRIQTRLNNMWDINFDQVSNKKGFIRNKVISGALNYTSRSVICPDPTLFVNEVDISYQGFRILFKYRIIYYLMKILNISLADAYSRWRAAYKMDEYVYNIMNYIIEKEHPRILLNRNPTINLYSMLMLKIRRVKHDWKRTTLSVPLFILPGLNADFDGDILNMIALTQPEFIRMFRKFDPLKKYIMSRRDGSLNKLFAIGKGQLVDLYNFANFKDEKGLEELNEEKLLQVVSRFEENDKKKPIYLPSGKIMMV